MLLPGWLVADPTVMHPTWTLCGGDCEHRYSSFSPGGSANRTCSPSGVGYPRSAQTGNPAPLAFPCHDPGDLASTVRLGGIGLHPFLLPERDPTAPTLWSGPLWADLTACATSWGGDPRITPRSAPPSLAPSACSQTGALGSRHVAQVSPNCVASGGPHQLGSVLPWGSGGERSKVGVLCIGS